MKLLSSELEMRAIKTLCSAPDIVRNKLLASLGPDFFYYEPTSEAYERVMAVVKAKGYIPDYAEISSDPTISEESRSILKDSDAKPCKSAKTMGPLVESLDQYRKLRGLYFTAEETINELKKSKVDLDKLVEANSDSLMKIRTKSTSQDQLVHMGKGNNSVALVKKLLSNERTKDVVPSGFSTYDDRVGGFSPGSLVLIGATTGGGKCLTFETKLDVVRSVYVRCTHLGRKLGYAAFEKVAYSSDIHGLLAAHRDRRLIESVEYVTDELQIGKLWDDNKETPFFTGEADAKMCRDLWVLSKDGPLRAVSVFKLSGVTIKLTFGSGRTLEGLPEHRLMKDDCTWVYLKDFSVGDHVLSVDGTDEVVSIDEGSVVKDVFDINVPVHHHYYANGLVSHNSALANQLLMNAVERGYSSVIIPLEMTKEETMARILANLSGIEVTKFLLGKLSKGEQSKVKKVYKEWVEKCKDLDARYSIYEPEEDVTAEDILFTLKPYGYKMILIDYMNLLKGVGGDDSWQALGNVARFAKIFAKTHNIVVVLLVQVSNDGIVRYSRTVVEHANNAWIWTYTDKSKETGILDIRQIKARNQEAFPFQLQSDFATMSITDLDDRRQVPRTKEGDDRRKKLDSTEDYLNDITDDDDDGDTDA